MSTCCFCLGGDTEIPAFGSIKDAEDLITPCQQCLLVCHRKCLLEWFNSLPTDKIKVVDVKLVADGTVATHQDLHIGTAPATLRLDITIDALTLLNWVSGLSRFTTDIDELDDSDEEIPPYREALPQVPPRTPLSSLLMVFLITQCPQCKSDIVFTLRRLPWLQAAQLMRVAATRFIQYLALFLGFTLAVTGVVTMGYVGLTSCGLKMMESVVPSSLLVGLLTRALPRRRGDPLGQWAQLIRGGTPNTGIDLLEQAMLEGLVDPLKFSRIPVLPVVLYRMRLLSLMLCLFGNGFDNPAPWQALFGEVMVLGYLLLLGDHELLRGVWANVARMVRDPAHARLGDVLRGINLWKTTNMLLMMVPARWVYDAVHRLTINRVYFGLTLRVRPRDITNLMSTSDAERLEQINGQLGELASHYHQLHKQVVAEAPRWRWAPHAVTARATVMARLVRRGFYQRWLQLKAAEAYCLLKATLHYDYSRKFAQSLASLRWISTLVWPYVSSKVGAAVFEVLVRWMGPRVAHNKLGLLANIIGLFAVVAAKDVVALVVNWHKANQLLNLAVVTRDRVPDAPATVADHDLVGFPGRFVN